MVMTSRLVTRSLLFIRIDDWLAATSGVDQTLHNDCFMRNPNWSIQPYCVAIEHVTRVINMAAVVHGKLQWLTPHLKVSNLSLIGWGFNYYFKVYFLTPHRYSSHSIRMSFMAIREGGAEQFIRTRAEDGPVFFGPLYTVECFGPASLAFDSARC